MNQMKTNVLQIQNGSFNRREFLAGTTAAALSVYATGLEAAPKPSANPTKKGASETAVQALYDSLSAAQRKEMCFDWNHVDPKRGLLRAYVTNNWRITPHRLTSDFYTNQQKDLIHDIFKGLIHPDWYTRFLKQNHDDNQGLPWGHDTRVGDLRHSRQRPIRVRHHWTAHDPAG